MNKPPPRHITYLDWFDLQEYLLAKYPEHKSELYFFKTDALHRGMNLIEMNPHVDDWGENYLLVVGLLRAEFGEHANQYGQLTVEYDW